MVAYAVALQSPGGEGSVAGWTQRVGSGLTIGFAGGTHSGNYYIIAGHSSINRWDQEIELEAGLLTEIDTGTCVATASAWHRVQTGTSSGDTGYLYLEAYDASLVLLDSDQNALSGPTTWTQESVILTLPTGTRYLRIGTYNDEDGPGTTNENFWDDFALEIEGNFDPSLLNAKSSQTAVYAWASEPAEQLRNSQGAVVAWGAAEEPSGLFELKTHQVAIYAWVKGYVEQPHVRAWTYSLDGHDYYVLRLATLWTVVLDLATGQWSEWFGHNLPYWRAHTGINWLGMGADTALRLYGTNVVAGDDRAGILWMLDPTTGIDDGVTAESADVPFNRAVTGIVQQRMRASTPCGGVYLTVSLGQPIVAGAAITLDYSDDGGNSYVTAGSVTVDSSDYNQEIAFRSLGLIRAPGRVFRITDNGASVRINAADLKS